MKSGPRHFVLWITFLAAGTASALAGEKIEIKYLAPDGATMEQMKADLHLAEKSGGEEMAIYFFDTSSLALLGDHLILRLRKKQDAWEFTVKERPANQQAQGAKMGEIATEKTVGKPDQALSYSIDSNPPEAAVKDAIEKNAVQGLLSSDQQAYLKNRSPAVPWELVRCFGKIQAVRWDLPQLKKLDAEDWKFSGGEVLELSLNAKVKDASASEAEFSKFLAEHNLKPEKSGGMKTSTVLQTLKQQLSPK